MKTVVYLVVDNRSIVMEMIPKNHLGLWVKERLDGLAMPGCCRQEG